MLQRDQRLLLPLNDQVVGAGADVVCHVYRTRRKLMGNSFFGMLWILMEIPFACPQPEPDAILAQLNHSGPANAMLSSSNGLAVMSAKWR